MVQKTCHDGEHGGKKIELEYRMKYKNSKFCYCLKIKSFITVIITNLPHQHGKRYHLLQEGIIII